MSTPSREIRLLTSPAGALRPGDLTVAASTVPDPGPGEVLVRNLVMAVEAVTRLRMDALRLPFPRYRPGDVLDGRAVGEVVASASPDLAAGDLVLHPYGWREHAVGPAGAFTRVDPAGRPGDVADLLGMGFTAYVGLFDVAGLKPGETVYVSSAAGAVGSVAGQLARIGGAGRVVGSTGSAEKVRWLRDELGYDAAFDHHDGPLADRLAEAAPDGVDVYFDNVGGATLEAALDAMNPHGRVALCGAVSLLDGAAEPPGVRNLLAAVARSITLRGFSGWEFPHRRADWAADQRRWQAEGRLRPVLTALRGLDSAPAALAELARGAHRGTVVVRLAD
ncbi:MAG: NADP-dependent oxidoreductase [Mycobacteriales bacterium]